MRHLLFLLPVVFFLSSCGGGGSTAPQSSTNPQAKFVATEQFVFTAAIDPATLQKVNGFSITHSFDQTRALSYPIWTQLELGAFNQTVSPDERVTLEDLDAFTYFFVRAPGCPDFYELAGHSYEGGVLTLTLNRFTVPDVACPAVLVESYDVFKARK